MITVSVNNLPLCSFEPVCHRALNCSVQSVLNIVVNIIHFFTQNFKVLDPYVFKVIFFNVMNVVLHCLISLCM